MCLWSGRSLLVGAPRRTGRLAALPSAATLIVPISVLQSQPWRPPTDVASVSAPNRLPVKITRSFASPCARSAGTRDALRLEYARSPGIGRAERRNAPANPRRRSARSRRPFKPAGSASIMRRSSAALSAFFFWWLLVPQGEGAGSLADRDYRRRRNRPHRRAERCRPRRSRDHRAARADGEHVVRPEPARAARGARPAP